MLDKFTINVIFVTKYNY